MNLLFHVVRILARGTPHGSSRKLNAIVNAAAPNGGGGFAHSTGRTRLLRTRIASHALQVALQATHLIGHGRLALIEPLLPLRRTTLSYLADVARNLALLLGQFLRPFRRVLHAVGQPCLTSLFEQPPRLFDLLGGSAP